MKHQTKLSQEQQQAAAHQTGQQAAHEFATAEELLRFDAAQTAVPPQIAEKLKRTTSQATSPPRSGWLKRFFGGTNL
jgi:hypothetical protein